MENDPSEVDIGKYFMPHMSPLDASRLRRMMLEHGPAVLAAAEAYADGSLSAEDIFQETFIRAWRKLATGPEERCIAGWLCQTALNIGRDHWRKEERRRSLMARFLSQPATKPPPSIGQELARRALWRQIDALPERQRAAVLLKHIDGLKAPEIGERMGITPGTARATLRDAHASLRRSLGIGPQEGGTIEMGQVGP